LVSFILCLMLLLMLAVDYILKDPTERERLNIYLTPRVYPQWLVIVIIDMFVLYFRNLILLLLCATLVIQILRIFYFFLA